MNIVSSGAVSRRRFLTGAGAAGAIALTPCWAGAELAAGQPDLLVVPAEVPA